MAKVISVNSEIKGLYGYENKDVIGLNINEIMPLYYNELHDLYFEEFFESEEIEREYIDKERIVYPITYRGYAIPSSLMIKLLPTLDENEITLVTHPF